MYHILELIITVIRGIRVLWWHHPIFKFLTIFILTFTFIFNFPIMYKFTQLCFTSTVQCNSMNNVCMCVCVKGGCTSLRVVQSQAQYNKIILTSIRLCSEQHTWPTPNLQNVFLTKTFIAVRRSGRRKSLNLFMLV